MNELVSLRVEDRVAVASNWRLVWWRFRRHHLAMASAGLLIFLYLIVLVPNFFSTQDPERTDARQAFIPVQMVHFFNDGTLSPWVPAIVGKRNPTTLRMEWVTDPQKKEMDDVNRRIQLRNTPALVDQAPGYKAQADNGKHHQTRRRLPSMWTSHIQSLKFRDQQRRSGAFRRWDSGYDVVMVGVLLFDHADGTRAA